jgi:membrane protease YdiL (CAAX protease family)
MSLPELVPAKTPLHTGVIKALQRHALVRSIAYGVVVNAIGFSASYIVNPTRTAEWTITRLLANHVLAAPFIAGVTYAFITLRDEDRDWWERTVRKGAVQQFWLGIGLGSGTYLVSTAVAASMGWVSFRKGGWQTLSSPEVIKTLVSHLGHLGIAWNEEMLYRGYGLHSLAEAIGFPAATTLLIPLFAWGHGEGWHVFVGQCSLGLALTTLRMVSDSIWLPIGYHTAWNYVQTAVIGPPDGAPSLWPMHVEGPHLWMGRPGHPEPGLLSMLTNLSVAAGALCMWHRTRAKRDTDH